MTSWDNNMYQELTQDIKDIKSTLNELKDAFTQHCKAQPQFGQPFPYFPFPLQPASHSHFQPSTPSYADEYSQYSEDTPPPLPPSLPQTIETPAAQLTTGYLMNLKEQSCSRPNFGSKLARDLFTEVERKSSNVKGLQGKKQLDPKRILQIKEAVFQIYPLETGESHNSAWAACCKAIDSSNRSLNRPPKVKGDYYM